MSVLRLVAAVPAAARAGGRIARTGVSALEAAAMLRRLDRHNSIVLRRERSLFLRDLFRRVCELHAIRVRCDGAMPVGPALLASNHVSYLDPIVLGSLVPCVPISKVDVSGWPVIGGFARDLGVIFVDRSNGHSGMRVLREAARALAEGVSVLNFPEGTTTAGDRVLRFREGLFTVARSAGQSVVPVAVAYDPPELAWVDAQAFVPHYLRVAGSARARAHVIFGTPLESRAYPSGAALAAAAHDAVESLLGGAGGAARSA
jgi:1-acyl-sn-glycerol-3-phosphate acyltransferase